MIERPERDSGDVLAAAIAITVVVHAAVIGLVNFDWPGRGLADVPASLDVVLVEDRKSTRLNSSHVAISYAVFCLKKKKQLQHGNLADFGRLRKESHLSLEHQHEVQ